MAGLTNGEKHKGEEEEESTTVDPSYVIHLIRKILPLKAGVEEDETMEDSNAAEDSNDDPREEAGCVLWDLAANESIAELMVENFIIDVLAGVLKIPQSNRMQEICIGILGNLAFFETPGKRIAEKEELLPSIVERLCGTDTPTLAETCRLLNVGLHSEQAEKWIEAVKSDEVLERLLWIAQNTLNEQLMEKVLELLRTMVDSSKKIAPVLLPCLMPLGIVNVVKSVVASQLSGVKDGFSLIRDEVLDLSLQAVLEMSLSDSFSSLLAEDQELVSLAFEVIRLSWKDELSMSAVTAMVLLANLVTEKLTIVEEMCKDGELVERLVGLFPSTGSDQLARRALWSIITIMSKWMASASDCPGTISFAKQSGILVNELEEDALSEDRETVKRKLATMEALLKIFNNSLVSHENNDLQRVVKDGHALVERTLKKFEWYR